MDCLKEVAKCTLNCCAGVVLLYVLAVTTAVEKGGNLVFRVLDNGSGPGISESSTTERNNGD